MRSRSVPMSEILAHPTLSLDPKDYLKARAVVEGDAIRIYDEDGETEIVGWVSDEWVEDPDVVYSIVNALKLFFEQGPHAVKEAIGRE